MLRKMTFVSCTQDEILPVLPAAPQTEPLLRAHLREETPFLPALPVGTTISRQDSPDIPLLKAVGHRTYSFPGRLHAVRAPLLKALTPLQGSSEHVEVNLAKHGVSLAWITLSDSGADGKRVDASGPLIEEYIRSVLPVTFSQGFLIPDDPEELRRLLTVCALEDRYDIICTSGGTGLTSRDITPEATQRVLDRELPGFAQAMMAHSLQKTPKAVLSRSLAGVLAQSLIINLPGSVKAVRENLEAVLPALEHTVAKIHDDVSPCGG